ncbi:glycoside hydrolase family 28 protein [Mucilaginibacter sp. X4EP1]|uniref:glycoside hydrolase family 28 protein n=1 Tax=Mucilaginibacter sp. X4EP1 TaxID=2723092 RepID=UPI00216A146A|nr:glycosyl hydrolase family 28 protein [Mucilaginibacter sp. X4EP1]MCS3815198.1 polygalacturonase [Mucilaginibacter sp. X4EP1]
MNLFSRLTVVLCCLFIFSSSFAQTFNIKDYGALSDGKTVNTAAIQKAIDACYQNGGGRVYVPAGVFITGTFHLKSNMDLYLENGAVLFGSPNLQDYESYTKPDYGLNYYGILYTVDAENVSISGAGTIDGNNKVFFDFDKAKKIDANGTRFTRQKENYRHVESGIGDGPVVPKDRPRQMVIFSDCKHVQLRDISLLNSPFWTLHFADCDDVSVTGIRLWSGILVPNADGIDVTSCSNVVIANCDIRSGDDALVFVGYDHHFEIPGFKGLRHLSENITVTNCNLQSYSSGIRIGFLDQNTVRNVHISHCNITNSSRGIGIFLRDQGSLENITFSDITIETHLHTGDWWGNGEPIHISAVRGKENVKMGVIKNVEFNNITCIGENGILLYGSDESAIQDVRFNHVSMELVNSKLNGVMGGNIDLRGCLYEKEQLFESNIPGLLAHYVNGLTLNDFKLTWDNTIDQPYFTNGIEVNNFKDLKIVDFKGTSSPSNKNLPVILLKDGSGAVIGSNASISKQNVDGFEKIK